MDMPSHISAKLTTLLHLVSIGCKLDLDNRLNKLQAAISYKLGHRLDGAAGPAEATKNSDRAILDHFGLQ